MSDFFEIDFLDVEAQKSGDAIAIRYSTNGSTYIHVTDGGFLETGETLVDHINTYYGAPRRIDAVIVSHSDGDHAAGLRQLFGKYELGGLWMLRPWLYASELLARFSRCSSVESLERKLKDLYPHIATLEALAQDHEVPIYEPFQGMRINAFTVMAPTKARYLDLIVESEKTPVANKSARSLIDEVARGLAERAISYIRAAWGQEDFPPDDTSAENNMSVVQYAILCGKRILLTADAGRAGLEEVATFAPRVGLVLPGGIDRIQIPHHGSRHNVSTEVLNKLLGPPLPVRPDAATPRFIAIVSASKADKDHPRKSVVRAFIHRGGRVISTEGGTKRTGSNAPPREGWGPAEPVRYPEDQEAV